MDKCSQTEEKKEDIEAEEEEEEEEKEKEKEEEILGVERGVTIEEQEI